MNLNCTDIIKLKLERLKLGIIEFTAEVKDSGTKIWHIIEEESEKIKKNICANDITNLQIISDARLAYKKCGKDPSRYRPSADSLIRRIVKGNDLYKLNNVVDVLNLVSIQTGFSIGGYNVSKIKGNILLDIGLANEEYYGIGRGKLNIEGLPVLRDEQGVFGSPTSDSERTMISPETKNIAFVFFDFGCSNELVSAMHTTKEYLEDYCLVQDVKLSTLQVDEPKQIKN
jgi:DNA/RNA-binding domain of Phe-tRNA-synthetase-like protein